MSRTKKFKMTDLGPIPDDWEVRSMGEHSSIARGGSPRPIDAYLTTSASGVNWIKIGDSSVGGKYIYRTAEKIISEGVARSRLVHSGDLLLSNSMSFGRPYILKIDGCIHDGWLVIQDYKEVFDTEFLYYVLGIPLTTNQYRALAAGSGVQNLNKELVANVSIIVPKDISEQRRIAAALSDADELIASLTELLEKKRNLKKGAMQQLLTGKRRLPGFNGKWVEKEVGSLGTTYNGLTGKTKADFGNGNARYVTFLNVLNNPAVTEKEFEFVRVGLGERQNLVKKGDLFFNTSSETPEEVGIASTILDDYDDLYLNSFCFGFRFFENAGWPLFYSYWFRSQKGRDLMSALAQGSTRFNLSKDSFREAVIYVPPALEEQRAIAEVLSDMDEEIVEIEAEIDKAKNLKTGMMQQLLTGKVRLEVA